MLYAAFHPGVCDYNELVSKIGLEKQTYEIVERKLPVNVKPVSKELQLLNSLTLKQKLSWLMTKKA